VKEFYFAQKAFIVDNGKLLVVRKSMDDPHNPGRWEVPGGRMNFGEDVDEHICREVKEEVGLAVIPGRPFYLWQWQLERHKDHGEKLNIQIVAVARLCRPLSLDIDTAGRVEDDFLGEVDWVDGEALQSLDIIPNMKPVIEQFLALAELEDGH